MSEGQKQKHQSYREDYEILAKDIALMIDDLEFQIDHGGQVLYAIDTSVINLYVFPDRVNRQRSFLLLVDDWKQAPNLTLLILSHLFFHPTLDGRRILLPPYLIEVENFDTALLRHFLNDAIKDTAAAFDEIRSTLLAKKSEFGDFLDREPKSLSETERETLIQLLREHAPNVLTYLAPIESALYRLRGLYTGVFSSLIDILDQPLGIDNSLVERWSKKIQDLNTHRQARPDSSTLDAIAMHIMIQVNQSFQATGRPNRLVLVTNSQDLADFVHEERQQQDWPLEVGDFIRHPRIFNLLFRIRGDNPQDQLRELKQQQADVDALLRMFAEGDTSNHPSQELEQRIIENWRSTDALASSLGKIKRESDAKREKEEDFAKVIAHIHKLLKTDDKLRGMIREQLVVLFNDIKSDQLELGMQVVFKGVNQSALDDLRKYLKVTQGSNAIYTLPQALPYRIEFYIPSIRGQLDDWITAEAISLESISKLLRDEAVSSQAVEYERWLGLGVVFATFNLWNAADVFCDRALEVANDQIGMFSPHEAIFFKAICLHKINPDLERHQLALELLDQAQLLLHSAYPNRADPDPRYMSEKAYHIFRAHLAYAPLDDIAFPPAEVGMQLVAEALILIGDEHENVQLRLGLLNKRLYFCVEADYAPPDFDVNEEFERFQNLLIEYIPNKADWPSNIVDTIAWLRFRLQSQHSMDMLRDILEDLESCRNNPTTRDYENIEVREHIRKVREQLDILVAREMGDVNLQNGG